VTHDILAILAEGPRRPVEIRGMFGFASANYFTAQYLTPMRKAGYIAQVGEANPHSPRQEYRPRECLVKRAFAHFGVRAGPSSPPLPPRQKQADRNESIALHHRPAQPRPLHASVFGLEEYSCAIPRIAPHRECYATLV
jgi:hypothetical protein